MSDQFTQEQHERMEDWLNVNGYGGYEAWAEDSGYVCLREPVATPTGWTYTEEWLDEHGNPVDLYIQVWIAMEAEQETVTESEIGV